MLLPPEEAALFLSLYQHLITFAAAQEFGPRRPDGTAVLKFDTLAVYPNLIRNQILYVYAHQDRIVCATVAERTAWSKADLKPPAGHTLMR